MPENECPTVAVFGDSAPREGSAAYETARETGRVLARLGCAVANGGYRGTMEASARGAKEAGGQTVGVLCTLWSSAPNEYLDRTVTVDDLYARVGALIELGTAGYVALPGGTGTLVEVAVAWELMCKKFLAPRPLVCVGEFWRPMMETIAACKPASADHIAIAPTPADLAEFFPPR